MRDEATPTFLAVFIAMFLTGAGLILSIPPLFRPHEPYQMWTTVVFAGLCTVLAVATLYLHPTKSPRAKRDAGGE